MPKISKIPKLISLKSSHEDLTSTKPKEVTSNITAKSLKQEITVTEMAKSRVSQRQLARPNTPVLRSFSLSPRPVKTSDLKVKVESKDPKRQQIVSSPKAKTVKPTNPVRKTTRTEKDDTTNLKISQKPPSRLKKPAMKNPSAEKIDIGKAENNNKTIDAQVKAMESFCEQIERATAENNL